MNNDLREIQRRAGITPTSWWRKCLNGLMRLWKNIKGYALIAWVLVLIGWYRLWGKELPK